MEIQPKKVIAKVTRTVTAIAKVTLARDGSVVKIDEIIEDLGEDPYVSFDVKILKTIEIIEGY